MVNFRILNGAPKCTILENFMGDVITVMGPSRETSHHCSVEEALKHILSKGWEINIEHLKGPNGYYDKSKEVNKDERYHDRGSQ